MSTATPHHLVLVTTETPETVDLGDCVSYICHLVQQLKPSEGGAAPSSSAMPSPAKGKPPVAPTPTAAAANAAAAAALTSPLASATAGAMSPQARSRRRLRFEKFGFHDPIAGPMEPTELAEGIVAALRSAAENSEAPITVVACPNVLVAEALFKSPYNVLLLLTVTSVETFPTPPNAAAAVGGKGGAKPKPDPKKSAAGKGGKGGAPVVQEKPSSSDPMLSNRLEAYIKRHNADRFRDSIKLLRVPIPSSVGAAPPQPGLTPQQSLVETLLEQLFFPTLYRLCDDVAAYNAWRGEGSAAVTVSPSKGKTVPVKQLSSTVSSMEPFSLAQSSRHLLGLDQAESANGALTIVMRQSLWNAESNAPSITVQPIDTEAVAAAAAAAASAPDAVSTTPTPVATPGRRSPSVSPRRPSSSDGGEATTTAALPRLPPLEAHLRQDVPETDPSQTQWVVRQLMKRALGRVRPDSESAIQLKNMLTRANSSSNDGATAAGGSSRPTSGTGRGWAATTPRSAQTPIIASTAAPVGEVGRPSFAPWLPDSALGKIYERGLDAVLRNIDERIVSSDASAGNSEEKRTDMLWTTPPAALLLRRSVAAAGKPVLPAAAQSDIAVEAQLLHSVEKAHSLREIAHGLTQSLLEQVVHEEFPAAAAAAGEGASGLSLVPYTLVEPISKEAMVGKLALHAQRYGAANVKMVRVALGGDLAAMNRLSSAASTGANATRPPCPVELIVAGLDVPQAAVAELRDAPIARRARATLTASVAYGSPSVWQHREWTAASNNKVTDATTSSSSLLSPAALLLAQQSGAAASYGSAAATSGQQMPCVPVVERETVMYPMDGSVVTLNAAGRWGAASNLEHTIRYANADFVASLRCASHTTHRFTCTFDDGVLVTCQTVGGAVSGGDGGDGEASEASSPTRADSFVGGGAALTNVEPRSPSQCSSVGGASPPAGGKGLSRNSTAPTLTMGNLAQEAEPAPRAPTPPVSRYRAPSSLPSLRTTVTGANVSVSFEDSVSAAASAFREPRSASEAHNEEGVEGEEEELHTTVQMTFHRSHPKTLAPQFLRGTLDGATVDTFAEVEISRSIGRLGNVTKYFLSGSRQVLFADGTVATLIVRRDHPQPFWLFTSTSGLHATRGEFPNASSAVTPLHEAEFSCEVLQSFDRESQCDVFSRSDGVLTCFYHHVDGGAEGASTASAAGASYPLRVVVHADGTVISSVSGTHPFSSRNVARRASRTTLSSSASAPLHPIAILLEQCEALSSTGKVSHIVEGFEMPRVFLFAPVLRHPPGPQYSAVEMDDDDTDEDDDDDEGGSKQNQRARSADSDKAAGPTSSQLPNIWVTPTIVEFGDGSMLKRLVVPSFDPRGESGVKLVGATEKVVQHEAHQLTRLSTAGGGTMRLAPPTEFLQTVFSKATDTTIRVHHDAGLIFVEPSSVRLAPLSQRSIALCEGVAVFDVALGGFQLVDHCSCVTAIEGLYEAAGRVGLAASRVTACCEWRSPVDMLLQLAPTGYSPQVLPRKQRRALRLKRRELEAHLRLLSSIPSLQHRLRVLVSGYIVAHRLISQAAVNSVADKSLLAKTAGSKPSLSSNGGDGTASASSLREANGEASRATLTSDRPLLFSVDEQGHVSQYLSMTDLAPYANAAHVSPVAVNVRITHFSGEPGVEQISFSSDTAATAQQQQRSTTTSGPAAEGLRGLILPNQRFGQSPSASLTVPGRPLWVPRTLQPPRRYLTVSQRDALRMESEREGAPSSSADGAPTHPSNECSFNRTLLRFQPLTAAARHTLARREVRVQSQLEGMRQLDKLVALTRSVAHEADRKAQEALAVKYAHLLEGGGPQARSPPREDVLNLVEEQADIAAAVSSVHFADIPHATVGTTAAGATDEIVMGKAGEGALARRLSQHGVRQGSTTSLRLNTELSDAVRFEPPMADFGAVYAGYRYALPVVLRNDSSETLLFEIFRPRRRPDGVQLLSVRTSRLLVSPYATNTIEVLLNVPELASMLADPSAVKQQQPSTLATVQLNEVLRMECVALKRKFELQVSAAVVLVEPTPMPSNNESSSQPRQLSTTARLAMSKGATAESGEDTMKALQRRKSMHQHFGLRTDVRILGSSL